jgi:hypothetical protein
MERMALDYLQEFRDDVLDHFDGHIIATGFVPRMPKVHMQDFGLELSSIVISHENKTERKYAGVLVTMDTLDGCQGEHHWLARPSAEHHVYANGVAYPYRIQQVSGYPCDLDRFLREEVAYADRLDNQPLMDSAMKTFILRGILELQAVRFGKELEQQLRAKSVPASKPF